MGLGPASSPHGIGLPGGGGISAVARVHSVTFVVHNRPDLVSEITLGLDDTVAQSSEPLLHLVGEAGHGVVILSDNYPSHPGGLSYCQAGREEFLRVLNLKPPAHEMLKVKLTSCITSLELDDAGVIWNTATRHLEIHWIGTHVKYQIGPNGEARLVNEKGS